MLYNINLDDHNNPVYSHEYTNMVYIYPVVKRVLLKTLFIIFSGKEYCMILHINWIFDFIGLIIDSWLFIVFLSAKYTKYLWYK